MIIIGWERDSTIRYLRKQLELVKARHKFFALDDLLLREDVSPSELLFEETVNEGIYSRVLNPGWKSGPLFDKINALSAILEGWPSDRICNRPAAIPTNFSKALHLTRYSVLLEQAAIKVPRTLLSNSQLMVSEFANSVSELVVKGVSSKKSLCVHYDSFHEAQSSSPFVGLLQERIVGPDVRIHVTSCGYVAEVFVTSEIDYRFSRCKRSFIAEVPPRILTFCQQILVVERISFAGVDFKLDVEGNWWFLEANASPAFQGFDVRSKGRIVKLLIEWDAAIQEASQSK